MYNKTAVKSYSNDQGILLWFDTIVSTVTLGRAKECDLNITRMTSYVLINYSTSILLEVSPKHIVSTITRQHRDVLSWYFWNNELHFAINS